jgi:hypothetical protein
VQGLHYSALIGLRYDNWVVKVAPPSTKVSAPLTTIDKIAFEEKDFTIKAFPNPFSHQATLQFTALASGRARVDLYNSSGVQVQTAFDGSVSEGQRYTVIINDALLPKGTYFYIISNKKNRQSGRLIKN